MVSFIAKAQIPTITTVSPNSGTTIPATIVTITGTNFSNIADSNIVYFGATQAKVITANTSTLIVAAPIGATYQNITVLNTETDLQASSSQPFLTTFKPRKDTITVVDFLPKVDFDGGATPFDVSIADLDNDGKPDIVATNYNGNTISVLRNTSTKDSMSFDIRVEFITGSKPYNISIADLNGDGKLDIVVTKSNTNTLAVFQNTSTVNGISFDSKKDFWAGDNPYNTLSIADLDRDGRPDIIIGQYSSKAVLVLQNTSIAQSISFDNQVLVSIGSYSQSFSIADIDSDEKLDIVVTNPNKTISVLRNTSTYNNLSFDIKVVFVADSYLGETSIADLDNDEKTDIIVISGENTISILRNTSAGDSLYFDSSVYLTSDNLSDISIGNLDSDAKPDIVVLNTYSKTVSIFRNTSTSNSISFNSKVDFSTDQNFFGTIGDLNIDGKPDIVVTLSLKNAISILLNDPKNIQIDSIANHTLCVNDSIAVPFIITGTFNSANEFTAQLSDSVGNFNNAVNIGTIKSKSNGIINAVIPQNINTGIGYRMRIVSNNPVYIGENNGIDLQINSVSKGGKATASISSICKDSSTYIALTNYNGSIQWQQSEVGKNNFSNLSIGSGIDSVIYTTTKLAKSLDFRALVKSGSCATANSTITTVTVNPPSVGGIISGSDTVCTSSNNTTLTLSGQTGNITKWQSSTVSDFSSAVTDINDTTTQLIVKNLTSTTYYRAVITSGVCASVNSNIASITVSTLSVGGIINGSDTVCTVSNSTTLILSGQIGNITKWQSSTVSNFASDVIDIDNVTNKLTVNNLTTETYYRAEIKNDACSSQKSSIATIALTGEIGIVTASANTICESENTTLYLFSYKGNIEWQQRESGKYEFQKATNSNFNSAAYITSKISQSVDYRAIVRSGNCAVAISNIVSVNVNPLSVGGTVSGSSTVCSGSNNNILTLSGYIGNITKWQSSTVNNFTSDVTNISNTDDQLLAQNLNTTLYYRAVVTNGVCPSVFSNIASMTVNQLSVGGTITGEATVCADYNSTTLILSGHIGTVTKWQSSLVSDFNSNVIDISNTTTQLIVKNLNTTTYYRAVVTSGECAATSSNISKITVDQLSKGGSIEGSTTVCAGNNSTILILGGHTGTITKWQSSSASNFSSGVSDINNSTTQLIVKNLNNSNYYRAVVTNSACSSINSSISKITVIFKTPNIPENITGYSTICQGSTSTYYTATVNGVETYEWNTPQGWPKIVSQNSITTTASSNGGLITVSAINACGISPKQTLNVNILDMSVSQSNITLISNAINAKYQWIDCDNNNLPIANGKNQSFVVSKNGSYAVVLNIDYCADTSSCVSISNIYKYENHNSKIFEIYPNPSNGKFIIKSSESMIIEILDLLGHTISKIQLYEGINNINICNVSNGMYFIKSQENSIYKFVVQE